jgi:predicted permease
MRRPRIVLNRLRSLFGHSRADADLQREVDLHLDQLTREHLAAGLSESDARLAARREFGSVEGTKELCRDVRRVALAEDLVKDLRYALRVLRRSPGFAFTAVLSLALGIGANTAIFSMVNAFLLRPLPFERPDGLVSLFERNVAGSEQEMSVAPGNFLDWQASSKAFESISAYTMRTFTLSDDAPGFEPQRVMICTCSANLFSTLRVSPAIGRSPRPEEDRYGAPRVIVIGYDLWERQFHQSPDVIGRTIRLNEETVQIVGVMPRSFSFPNRNVDGWLPLVTTLPPAAQIRHDLHFLMVVGRLHPDVTFESGRAEIDAITARYKNSHANESTGKGAHAVPLHDVLVNGVRRPLIVLLPAVFCVLLIACVNIANLVLTRGVVRAREIGIRTALGAGRGRIVRQLITESVVLGLAGGVAGAILAVWIARLLVARAPGADAILPTGTLPLDPLVFLFAFVLSISTGIAVGLVPAVRGSRAEVTNDLKDANRSATGGRTHRRFRDVLVAAEIMLSLVLLVAAGLLLRSFFRLYEVQPGVRVDHTITMNTTLPTVHYRTPAQRSARLAEIGDRLRALPGVQSAGLVSCPPLTGACNTLFFYIEGRPYVPGSFFTAHERSVDPEYFSAAGIPLLKGRTFVRDDGVGFDPGHPRLGKIIISDSMAKTFFDSEDPVGKQIFFDFEIQRERNEGIPAPRYEVIGVVGDVVPTLEDRITPTLYRPMLDVVNNNVTMLLLTSVEPQSIVGAVRNEIHRLDPGLAIYSIRTVDELMGRSTADRRFTMLLFAAFAALAVLLAAVGLFGVVSYAVSQRTTEIGIRMALGATRGDVSRLVVMQGLRPAIVGITCGVVGAALASQALRSLLFGVAPIDPLTFSLVPPLLLAVAGLASYLPARRATHVDPTLALRTE